MSDEITRFLEYGIAIGLSNGRIKKYRTYLNKFHKILGKPYKNCSKDDIIRLFSILNKMDYSEWTRNDFKIMIKRFYKWLEGDDEEYPKKVKWIKISTKYIKIPEITISREEIYNLMEHSEDDDLRSLIGLLWETGARKSELMSLKVKDIGFEGNMAVLRVDGKTGVRMIPVIEMAEDLKTMVKRKSMNDRVFKRHERYYYEQIKNITRVLNLNKRVNFHQFRHSRATYLANFLTTYQMCKFFGWSMDSNMPRIYVHLSASDVKEAMQRVHTFEQNNLKMRDLSPGNMFG